MIEQYPRYAVAPVERVVVGERDVPALVVQPRAEGVYPGVLVQHGYGASKSDVLPLGEFFASLGFVALLPDAWGHGERFPENGPNWMNSFSPDFIVEILRNTVADMRDALTALDQRPDVRRGEHLVSGFSLGAIAALVLAQEDDRVAGVYSISGSPLPDLVHAIPSWMPGPGPEAEAWARAHDITAHLNHLAPKPLLLQHGRADDMVPVGGSIRLYEEAKPYYARHPERLELMLYDHRHDVTEAEVAQGLDWLLPFFVAAPPEADEAAELESA